MHWFSAKTKYYYCLAQCPEHGYIRGKIRLKKTEMCRTYVVKTLRLIDEEGAQQIRQMKECVLEKRREKRHGRNISEDGC
jgi:ribosome recycling factor